MNEKNLVICDKEFRYANGLGENISERSELMLKVYICTSLENVIRLQNKRRIHILIIDEKFVCEEREKIEAEQIFVLTKDGCKDLREDEKEVYKYQSADKILTEIFEAYYEKTNNNILKNVKKTKNRMIAVYSPIHRVGKTTFATALGKEMAKKEKTLYLNLEEYADTENRFIRAEGQNIGDLIYYLKQEKGDFALRLSNMVKQMDELEYVPPMLNCMDLKEICMDDWINLMKKILQESMYETVILDLSESTQGMFSIMQMCDKIFMPVLEDDISKQKVQRYEENLAYLQMNEILEKTYQFVVSDDMEQYARKVAKEEW